MSERVGLTIKKPEVNRDNSDSRMRRTDHPRSVNPSVDRILFLQKTVGNQAVQRLLRSGALQAKLRIGQPGDVYEQEADRVAEQVMRMPEPQVQRQVEPEEEEEILQTKPLVDQITPIVQRQVEEEEEEEMLQAKSREDATSEVPNDLESQINAIRSGGRPLAESERAYFEPRFGADFSQVKVHTDAKAAESARAISAVAYTAGRDIVFDAGKSPGRNALTAHELTHVLQQTGHIGSPSSIVQRQCLGSVGNPTQYATGASAPHLQCDDVNTGISDVTSRITAGRQRARVMINDALTVLNQMLTGLASADALTHFRRLFRLADPQPTNAQIRLAITIYNSICTWLTTPPATNGGGILCLTHDTGDCAGPYYGLAGCRTGVTTRQPIMLCPDGISTNSLQTAQTIIHEAAHRFGICTAPPRPGTPPPQERYEGETQFPTRPALRTSADSYSAFAREAHSLMVSERRAERLRQEEVSGMAERPPMVRQRNQ